MQEDHQTHLGYQGRQVSDAMADHIILDLFRKGVIGVQAIALILKTYERPPHD